MSPTFEAPQISIPHDAVAIEEMSGFRAILDATKRLVGRAALIIGLAAGPGVITGTAGSMLAPERSQAATEFANDYPNLDAHDYNVAAGEWSVDEDGDGNYEGGDELQSSRGYYYRNCTDGAAHWVKKYTGVDVRGWKNAENWDTAASSYTVKPGNSNSIEPGDIAQSDDGSVGHVGFVTKVVKDSRGAVTKFEVAELNKSSDGTYSLSEYRSRNSSGNFIRSTGKDWDHFIDVNGENKGLNNEDLSGGSGGGSGGYADGAFLKVNESGAIYRMVGGAPIRIYNQGALPDFAGQVTNISHAQLGTLPRYPKDEGDIISLPEAGGAKYRFVGGAPVRIHNCAALPGNCTGAIHVNFQSLAEHDHMLQRPKDGAAINIAEAGGSGIYRFVGGAPIRLFNWGAIPDMPVVIDVNEQSLATHDHMNTRPADGSAISIAEAYGSGIYRFAGGAPVRLFNQGAIPDMSNTVTVNAQSLAVHDHMNAVPADGTFIASTETGLVYRVAGGAPLRLYNQGGIPGYNGAVLINQHTIDVRDHMLADPASGTVLRGVTSGEYWQISNNKRIQVGANAGAVIVDEQTIASIPT